MLSNLLELLGLASLTVAAYVIGGLAPTLIVGGVALMFVGSVTDDAAIARAVRRGMAAPREHVASWRERRAAGRAKTRTA